MKKKFILKSDYNPAGDQKKAIDSLLEGLEKNFNVQTLHGATGTGKTFTMANIIQKVQKPTLVIAHNKTLAAQLAQEFKTFFPDNAVHYFVSYYDYYQPEAYVVATDTFIEKDLQINKEIDMLRHASTQSLLTRDDVIIIASVSCIYGLGSPAEYKKSFLMLNVGDIFKRQEFIKSLINIFYERTNADLEPGKFRIIGGAIEIMPINEDGFFYRIETFGGVIDHIIMIEAISRKELEQVKNIFLFPGKHFVTNTETKEKALKNIEKELKERVKYFKDREMIVEAQRLERRTKYDIAMIREVGYCSGIENYSRHLTFKKAGESADTLFSYFAENIFNIDGTKNTKNGKEVRRDFLTFVDESHMTIPQIGGMPAADASRKENLINHGFRLPSAADNRPLKFNEFEERVNNMICVSATPSKYEAEKSKNIAEQVIRPTGLLDPIVEVRPILERKKENYQKIEKNSEIEKKLLNGVEKKKTLKEIKKEKDEKSAQEMKVFFDNFNKKGYKGQVFDFIEETEKTIKNGGRIIATTLTKKMSEALSEFLIEKNIKSVYLHSEVDTLERIEIISDFRKGKYDVLIGVNLLREGLDMPEVEFIGILDADKEGFLRSETALVQTIGRAARNVNGKVILYAEKITNSMKKAILETSRRRKIQEKYNKENSITPKTIIKNIKDIRAEMETNHERAVNSMLEIEEREYLKSPKKFIKKKRKKMEEAVKVLDFETAAILRDEIKFLEEKYRE